MRRCCWGCGRGSSWLGRRSTPRRRRKTVSWVFVVLNSKMNNVAVSGVSCLRPSPDTQIPIQLHLPPSSLAMTSALSSIVYAMELLELPKVMPMATRSPGPAVDAAASLSLMSTVIERFELGLWEAGGDKKPSWRGVGICWCKRLAGGVDVDVYQWSNFLDATNSKFGSLQVWVQLGMYMSAGR